MNFYIMTLFPDMVMQGLSTSIIGRAKDKGLLSIEAVNIRDYTLERHKKVDDYPYGGGAGMLMQAQPVYDAWKSVVYWIQAKDGLSDTAGTDIHTTDGKRPGSGKRSDFIMRSL